LCMNPNGMTSLAPSFRAGIKIKPKEPPPGGFYNPDGHSEVGQHTRSWNHRGHYLSPLTGRSGLSFPTGRLGTSLKTENPDWSLPNHFLKMLFDLLGGLGELTDHPCGKQAEEETRDEFVHIIF